MERLFLYRHPSGKQVEFFSTLRYGKLVYLIREDNGQDSVTPDRESMELFKGELERKGFTRTPQ